MTIECHPHTHITNESPLDEIINNACALILRLSVCLSVFVSKCVESTLCNMCCPSAVFLSFSRNGKRRTQTHTRTQADCGQYCHGHCPCGCQFSYFISSLRPKKEGKKNSIPLCYFYLFSLSVVHHTHTAESKYERNRLEIMAEGLSRSEIVPDYMELVGPNREMRCANPN